MVVGVQRAMPLGSQGGAGDHGEFRGAPASERYENAEAHVAGAAFFLARRRRGCPRRRLVPLPAALGGRLQESTQKRSYGLAAVLLC